MLAADPDDPTAATSVGSPTTAAIQHSSKRDIPESDRTADQVRTALPVSRLGAYLDEHRILSAILLAAVPVAIVLAHEFVAPGTYSVDNGTKQHHWDLLFDSAWLTILIGLLITRGQAGRFDGMLTRLSNRRALQRGGSSISQDDLARIQGALAARAEKWERRSGATCAIVIAIVLTAVTVNRIAPNGKLNYALIVFGPGPLLGAVGGFLVGRPLGRMLSCGLIGRSLEQRGVSVRATPGHVDGAAGLKPLGDYFSYQALVLAIPAVFLVAWSVVLMVPTWATDTHSDWRATYLALVGIAICLELFGFVAPLWRAHRSMKDQKNRALFDVDAVLGPRIMEARTELTHDLDVDRRTALRDQLEELTRSYREIETMPTWPVDRSVYRRLTLGNLALIIPLIAQLTAAAADWKTL